MTNGKLLTNGTVKILPYVLLVLVLGIINCVVQAYALQDRVIALVIRSTRYVMHSM